MALVVKELLSAVQTSENFQKKGTKIRRFIVTTRDPKAALQADGIPPTRSAHPDDPTYLLDNKATSATGRGQTFVDCQYSNDRSGFPRNINKDDKTWYHWGWSYRDAEVPYFINVKERTYFSDQSDPVDMWTFQKDTILETRIIRPLYVRLEKVTDIRWLDPIRIQKNRLHLMPDGVTYRFLGGEVSQVDDYTYDVKYEWELDEGTPAPTYRASDTSNLRVNIPLAPRDPSRPNDPEMVRHAYYRLQPLASLDPTDDAQPNGVFETLAYVKDLQGWRTLPGANRVI